jgi:hypothetical protein
MIKNARTISQYLSQAESDEFKRILEEFQERKDEIVGLALKQIQAIEALFNHPSTITFSISNGIKLQAVDLALAKKAPFGTRNSMADALILLSAIDYIVQKHLTNCIFISNNTDDFALSSDKNTIHEDLQELFDKCGMRYFSNVGLAINTVEKDIISTDAINKIEEELRFKSLQRIFENYHQAIESIESIGGFVSLQEMFNKQQQIMESIKSVGGLSVLQETIDKHRQMMDDLKRTGNLSTFQEILDGQQRLMETLRATRNFATLRETFENQQRLMEDIKAIGGLTALRETFEKQQQMVEHIKSMGGLSTIRDLIEKQQQLLKIGGTKQSQSEPQPKDKTNNDKQ